MNGRNDEMEPLGVVQRVNDGVERIEDENQMTTVGLLWHRY